MIKLQHASKCHHHKVLTSKIYKMLQKIIIEQFEKDFMHACKKEIHRQLRRCHSLAYLNLFKNNDINENQITCSKVKLKYS